MVDFTFDVDLYGGLPGVTLFLAYLGAITGEQRYTALAQQACDTMLRRLEKNRSFVKSIGAFSGWGGVIYTLSHLGALGQEADWEQALAPRLGRGGFDRLCHPPHL